MRSTRAVMQRVGAVAGNRAQEAGLQLHGGHRPELAELRDHRQHHRGVGGGHHGLAAHHAAAVHDARGMTGSASTTSPGRAPQHAQLELLHPVGANESPSAACSVSMSVHRESLA